MTRDELVAALEAADAEGWKSVMNEAPPTGERVDVMHILNRSYDCDGECDSSGQWQCANGFIIPNGMFTFNPTHWRDKLSLTPVRTEP